MLRSILLGWGMIAKLTKLPIPVSVLQIFFGLTLIASILNLALLIASYLFVETIYYNSARSLVLNITALVIASGLLRRKRWAWVLGVISFTIGIITTGLFFVITAFSSHPTPWNLINFVGIVINALIVTLLIAYRNFYNHP